MQLSQRYKGSPVMPTAATAETNERGGRAIAEALLPVACS